MYHFFYLYHKRPLCQIHLNTPRIILVKAFPPNIAPSDNPTFAITLIANRKYCLPSIRLADSNEKDDMVVSPPQNPIATSIAYFWSRLHCWESMANAPRMKLPITFTIKTFTGSVPSTSCDFVIPYLRNTPPRPPTARRIISNSFIPLYSYPSYYITN